MNNAVEAMGVHDTFQRRLALQGKDTGAVHQNVYALVPVQQCLSQLINALGAGHVTGDNINLRCAGLLARLSSLQRQPCSCQRQTLSLQKANFVVVKGMSCDCKRQSSQLNQGCTERGPSSMPQWTAIVAETTGVFVITSSSYCLCTMRKQAGQFTWLQICKSPNEQQS